MIMEIISIILGVFLLGAVDYGSGGGIELPWLGNLVDIPSVIILMIFTVPVLFKGGMWRDFKRAWQLLNKSYSCRLSELRRTLDVVEMMQKQILYAGSVCLLMTMIAVLHMLSDLASLGPNLAVAILTMLYALFFEMLLLPLQFEVKRRIIDYMDIDTEEKVTMEAAAAKADLTNEAETKTENSVGQDRG